MFKKMKRKLQMYALNYLIKNILNFVTVDEMLLIDRQKNAIINTTGAEKAAYQRDASMILESELFKKMITDIYYMANMKATKYSKGEEDIIMAKSWLFFTEYMKEFLDKVANSQ